MFPRHIRASFILEKWGCLACLIVSLFIFTQLNWASVRLKFYKMMYALAETFIKMDLKPWKFKFPSRLISASDESMQTWRFFPPLWERYYRNETFLRGDKWPECCCCFVFFLLQAPPTHQKLVVGEPITSKQHPEALKACVQLFLLLFIVINVSLKILFRFFFFMGTQSTLQSGLFLCPVDLIVNQRKTQVDGLIAVWAATVHKKINKKINSVNTAEPEGGCRCFPRAV